MNAIKTVFQALNRSASLLGTKRNCYIFLGVVSCVAAAVGGYFLYKKLQGGRQASSPPPSQTSKQPETGVAAAAATSTEGMDGSLLPGSKSADEKAAFLVKESAKHVQQALETQKTNPMLSYENAVAASVLARTAKEVTNNTDALSEHLGVNFHRYVNYTSDVMNSAHRRLNRRVNTEPVGSNYIPVSNARR